MQSHLDQPQNWATGSDAPTDKQLNFAQQLADQKGMDLPSDLDKASASAFIDKAKQAPDDKSADTATADAQNGDRDAHLDRPDQWSTGDEPATQKQQGYIAVLEKKAGESVTSGKGLGKSEASERIEELKAKTD